MLIHAHIENSIPGYELAGNKRVIRKGAPAQAIYPLGLKHGGAMILETRNTVKHQPTMSQPMPEFPLADADKCVKCALCLPHCPTYRDSLDEGESPRGRIALMQGMATGALAITPTLTGHLDRCLDCRACEAVCPAEVPYGHLIDSARRELAKRGYAERFTARVFAWWMRSAARLRALYWLLWIAQLLRLPKLAAPFPSLARLSRLLPRVRRPHAWQAVYPAFGSEHEVELFLGCVARIVQPEVSAAAIRVLNALGYSVRVPPNQTCCGALDQHAGRSAYVAQLVRQNLDAFNANRSDVTIIDTASGCGATLIEYSMLTDDPRAPNMAMRVHDITTFILQAPGLVNIKFRPLPARVLIHSPCTLKNVLKSEKTVAQLLRLIPELEIDALPSSTGCCGAAGAYLINQPEISQRLADSIAATIAQQPLSLLISSNIGCALQLSAAIKRSGLDIPVMHPIELLAQQLPGA